MRLTELEPYFIDGSSADKRKGVGLMFNCPCGCENRCYVQFANPLDGGEVYDADQPKWKRISDTFENLTLTPSIHRSRGCGWHGYITNGQIITV